MKPQYLARSRKVSSWAFATKIALLTFGLLASILAYQYFKLRSWSQQNLALNAPVVVHLETGMPLAELSLRLSDAGVISDRNLFTYLLKIERTYPQFQAGRYHFSGLISPRQVIEKMVAGDVHRPLVLNFTIPEGFSLQQIFERLEALGVGSLQALRASANDPAFIATCLGLKAASLEGFLYPATYRFYETMPAPPEVFRAMSKEFFARLPEGYENSLKAKSINLYQAVIMASMIEKETLHESEMPLVSEVIWRRYKDGVPLAIDATLIYGIKDYKGNILTRHLRDPSNLYNSRIHPGLPPTPIGAVSAQALLAVVNPANEGNYFYVLLPDAGKKHHFSKTLKEHNKYVKKLVQALRAPRRDHR